MLWTRLVLGESATSPVCLAARYLEVKGIPELTNGHFFPGTTLVKPVTFAFLLPRRK
jgi:hypothetical protein